MHAPGSLEYAGVKHFHNTISINTFKIILKPPLTKCPYVKIQRLTIIVD